MNLIRSCRGQLLLTLFLFLAILVMPFQNYMERDFTSADMNYPEESSGFVGTDGGLLSVPDGAGILMLNSNDFYF